MNTSTDHLPGGKTAKLPSRRQQEARRRFLRSLLLATGILGTASLGFIPLPARSQARLRPPGALHEDELLSACIKCGQCLQVCPVQAIKLADLDDGFGIGVPYIEARQQACDFCCDVLQCVLACPTGALDHALNTKEQVRMGMARLTRPQACLAVQGQGCKGPAHGRLHRYPKVDRWNPVRITDHPYDLEVCDLCVRECPIEHAITLEPLATEQDDRRGIPVVQQACVGCGMCEMICPAEPAAIVVIPRQAQGNPA